MIETLTMLWYEVRILLIITFAVWFLLWIVTALWIKNKWINRADVFSVTVSCLWLFSLMTGLEISFWFDVMGAMATTHLIWEKSAKTFLEFMIKYKIWTK